MLVPWELTATRRPSSRTVSWKLPGRLHSLGLRSFDLIQSNFVARSCTPRACIKHKLWQVFNTVAAWGGETSEINMKLNKKKGKSGECDVHRGLCKAVTCYRASRRTHTCAGLRVCRSRVLEGLISHLWLTGCVQEGREGEGRDVNHLLE